MKVIAGIVRWVIAIAMVICLLFGIFYFFSYLALTIGIHTPSSMADLTEIEATVKQFDATKGDLKMEEYPNGVFSTGDSKSNNLIFNPGDKLRLFISKDAVSELNTLRPVDVIGIYDMNGNVLEDPKPYTEFGARVLRGFIIKSICSFGVPIIYFIAMYILRRRKKPQTSKVT